MDRIRFIKNPSSIYAVELKTIGSNVISLTFLNAGAPAYVADGFELINENNGKVMGSFLDYTTKYRTYTDKINVVELSNDGSVYKEPEPVIPTITFVANEGGTLAGDLVQQVATYDALVVPTVKAKENYNFIGWNPEIPTSGKIENNQTFYATFEYIPTEEEIAAQLAEAKKNKINYSKLELANFLEEHPITSTAHNGVEGVYSVTNEKQMLMMSQYTTYQIEKEVNPDAVLTWNETGKACEVWKEEEFLQLVLEIKAYVYPLVSYQQTTEEAINACSSIEEVEAIVIDYSAIAFPEVPEETEPEDTESEVTEE